MKDYGVNAAVPSILQHWTFEPVVSGWPLCGGVCLDSWGGRYQLGDQERIQIRGGEHALRPGGLVRLSGAGDARAPLGPIQTGVNFREERLDVPRACLHVLAG